MSNPLKALALGLTAGSLQALVAEFSHEPNARIQRETRIDFHSAKLSSSSDSTCGRPRLERPPSFSWEIAHSVSGFGGAFIKNGALNAYIVDFDDAITAKPVIHAQLHRQNRLNRPVRFIKGSFGYCELYGYEGKIGRVDHWSDGVSAVGIDERANRLSIGVINEEAREDSANS